MKSPQRRSVPWTWLAACLIACLLPVRAASDDLFEVLQLPVRGRTVAAAIAELDGDGRPDLWTANFRGVPPDEVREIHVRFQRADGGFGIAADAVLPLPPDAAAYDQAPLGPGGETELLFLRRDRVSLLSLQGRKPRWRDVATGGPTLAVAPDERGLDRLTLVRSGLGPGPLLTVPGLGEIILVRPSGAIVARLQISGRANYFIPPRPGPLVGENEIEAYVDHPRVSVGDVDGDGLADVIASYRHAIEVFRQVAGGEFSPRPSRTVPLRRISRSDHIRGSGSVRVATADLDGDGRADLLITHASEGLLDARSDTTLHYNRAGEWDLGEPDQRFTTEGGFATEELRDLDGDGRDELVSLRVPLGALELAEILITRSVDAHVAIRRPGSAAADPESDGRAPFQVEPIYTRKFSIPFSLETFRPRGFVGNVAGDWNGDGLLDLMLSGNGEAVEIHVGKATGGFSGKANRQKFDTNGILRPGELDGDGLGDFVLFDSRRPDTPVRLGRNLGRLPGTLSWKAPTP